MGRIKQTAYIRSLTLSMVESRLPGEISIISDMQMTPPMAESEELKSLLMKVKEESEKVGLKL